MTLFPFRFALILAKTCYLKQNIDRNENIARRR
jgi:hypothetical protein